MNERKREALRKLSKVQPRNYWNTSGVNQEYMRSAKNPDPTCEPEKQIASCEKCHSNNWSIQKIKGPAWDVKCNDCQHEMLSVHGRISKEPENPWWVDSPESGFCFWRWIQSRSTEDGKMEPMQQHEIARHLGCSATKVHFIIKEAIKKIKAEGYDEILIEYMGGDVEGEPIRPDATLYDSDSED